MRMGRRHQLPVFSLLLSVTPGLYAAAAQPPLDLTSDLLPATLPPGDPEHFALPVFLQEPAPPVSFVAKKKSVLLHCKAAHAQTLHFNCNGEIMEAANETEGRYEDHGNGDGGGGSRFRAVSLVVTHAMVMDIVGGDYTCSCAASSTRGAVKSTTVVIHEATIQREFVTAPHSSYIVEFEKQAELICHPPRGKPSPYVSGWLRNGVPIDPAIHSNFIISPSGSLLVQQARLEDIANYSCVAENPANRRISAPALLKVFIPGNWSEWTAWSDCNVRCGRGIQERQRTCHSPAPLDKAPECAGPAIDQQNCNAPACPAQDGAWTAWSAWTLCSPDCRQVRRRACADPRPSVDGHNCQGKNIVSRNCTDGQCRPEMLLPTANLNSHLFPVVVYGGGPESISSGGGGQQQQEEEENGGGAVPTSDLTLYIGLGVAFLVFILVVFVIVRLLRRKQRSAHSGYIAAGYSEGQKPALYSSPPPPRRPDLTAACSPSPVVCYEYTYSHHSSNSDTNSNSLKKGFVQPTAMSTSPFADHQLRPLSEHFYELPMRVFAAQPSPTASCSHRSNCRNGGGPNATAAGGLPASLGLPRWADPHQVAWTRVGEAGTRVVIPRSAVSLTVPQGAIEPGRTEEVWICVLPADGGGGGSAVPPDRLRPQLAASQVLIAPIVVVGPSHLSAHLRKPVVVSIPHSGGSGLRQVSVLQCDRLDDPAAASWRVVAVSDEEDTASSTSVYKDANMCQLVTERLAAFALSTNSADLLASSRCGGGPCSSNSTASTATSSGCSSMGSSPTTPLGVAVAAGSPTPFRIPTAVKAALCRLLDPPQANGGGDWHLLAERLGVNRYVGFFASQPSPTEALLNLWEARNRESTAVAGLVNILRGMGRQDAANILDQDSSWP